MVRAGIYARISLDKTGESLGTDRQVKLCRAKAEALGWTVADTYEDNDVSATKDVARPSYARLLADLQAGTIEAVVVYAIDRLTRRPAELESFIDLVERHGVALANVAGDVDLSTIQGRLTARIMGSVARAEAENIGKRVRDQKIQRASRGIPHKGRHRLYGYDESWQPLEPEASHIVEAFKRRASGESTTAICKDFKSRGIKTVSGRDWTSGVLGETLTKDVYAGWVTYKGERVSESIYPALIDDETFQAAQKNLANDSKGTNARKYLLSGILVCGKCGSPMKGNPSNQMYRCSTTYGGCGRLSVRIKLADEWVSWAAMEKSHEVSAKPQAPVRNYDSEIDALEAQRIKVQEAFEADIYSVKEAQTKIREIKGQIASLAKEQAKSRPRFKGATGKYFDYREMNLSQKRAFISAFIENVIVGPSISKGNQPFNPERFEARYTDGTRSLITPEPEIESES